MGWIDEPTAWAILDRFVEDCLQIDRDSLLAVYATGSLGGGYYRPGQSDIDAVLIVKDGSEEIWGNLDAASEALQALNRAYLEHYQIPKDFGPSDVSLDTAGQLTVASSTPCTKQFVGDCRSTSPAVRKQYDCDPFSQFCFDSSI